MCLYMSIRFPIIPPKKQDNNLFLLPFLTFFSSLSIQLNETKQIWKTKSIMSFIHSFIHFFSYKYCTAHTCKDAPKHPDLWPLGYSPAYLWHEGSACLPYRPPAVEAPAWCFRFHPAAGGHACARCPLSTASSVHPFCSGAASYKTGGFPSPAGKSEMKSKQVWPVGAFKLQSCL